LKVKYYSNQLWVKYNWIPFWYYCNGVTPETIRGHNFIPLTLVFPGFITSIICLIALVLLRIIRLIDSKEDENYIETKDLVIECLKLSLRYLFKTPNLENIDIWPSFDILDRNIKKDDIIKYIPEFEL